MRDDARPAIANVNAATEEAREAIASLNRTVNGLEGPVGDFSAESLPQLAFLWIVASLIIKITYRKQIQAEATAAQAVETAEAESLKRQVVEARMAAMQAQIDEALRHKSPLDEIPGACKDID